MDAHDHFTEQAAAYAIGALSPPERAQFEAHLATCASCAAEVRSYMPVAVALAQLSAPAEPSAEARRRVIEAARTDSRGNVVVITKTRPAALARRALTPWLAAAAALALAAGLGLYAYQLRQTAMRAQLTTAVLQAPDLLEVRLMGQPVAPQASARAFVSRTRGVVLTASNVPALPSGRTYQVWVLTAQTPPISVGLAKPDPTGRIAVTLPTADSNMPTPTGVAVTIEPEGGVPVATGPAYLVGTTN